MTHRDSGAARRDDRTAATVLRCGAIFDGTDLTAATGTEILVRDGTIAQIGPSVPRPDGAQVIELTDRTVCPGFIDSHVHLTMDASDLAVQTLDSAATKALTGLSIAQGYLQQGFTTLRDPAVMTWFDDEFEALCATAHQLGLPVAVHTGAADACKQAIRSGVRSLEHAYLIDEEGVRMAAEAGVFIVPTMQMTQEDLAQLEAATLPEQAVWKFSRDSDQILRSQQLIAAGDAEIVFGTDCGMFPFDHGVLEFRAMVDAGVSPLRALRAATSTAARMLGRADIGVLRTGASADIVAMPGNPFAGGHRGHRRRRLRDGTRRRGTPPRRPPDTGGVPHHPRGMSRTTPEE